MQFFCELVRVGRRFFCQPTQIFVSRVDTKRQPTVGRHEKAATLNADFSAYMSATIFVRPTWLRAKILSG